MAHPSDPLQALQPLGFGPGFQKQMCALLEAARTFNDWEWRDIEGLATHLRAYQAPAGATLFREGDPGDHLCLVIAGRIDIVKEDRGGERKVVASFGTGKTFGEMAIVDGEPRSATAIVAQTGTIAILTRADFARLVADRPPLAIKLVLKVAKILSQRLRLTTGVLVDHIGA